MFCFYTAQVKNALFLVRLEACEGEFPLGLAVRAFNNAEDDVANGSVQIRWYTRKATTTSWGGQPAFKYAPVFNIRRQSQPWLANIAVSSILDVPVVCTPGSVGNLAEPVLSRDCMSLVRSHMEALAAAGEWVREEGKECDEEDSSDEEVEDSSMDVAPAASAATARRQASLAVERKRRRSTRS
eukprot:691894-Pleurochrysis_carterae.AAC.1